MLRRNFNNIEECSRASVRNFVKIVSRCNINKFHKLDVNFKTKIKL